MSFCVSPYSRNFLKQSVSTLVIMSVLAGCSSEQSRNQVLNDASTASNLAQIARRPAPFVDTGVVRKNDGVYIAASAQRMGTDKQLPSKWQGKKLSFVDPNPKSFREILHQISSITGMPVSFSAAAQKAVAANTAQPSGSSDSASAALPRSGVPALVAGLQSSVDNSKDPSADVGLSASSVPSGKMKLNYEGSLSGFLDLVASNFGVSWIADGDRLIFSSLQTKTFDIPALPVVLKLSTQFSSQGANISGGGGGGASGSGSSNDSVSTTTAVEVYKDISSGLKSIVQGSGGVDISGSTGTITVTAPPDTIAQVASYVRDINRRLSKEIVMNITVYSVNLSKKDNYSANINTILQNSKYGVGVSSAGSAFTGLTQGAAAAFSGVTGQQAIGFAVTDPNSKFAGTNGILQALSAAGEVSIVNSQSVTTMNGIPVPFRDVNLRGYVSKVTTTPSAGLTTAAQTSIEQSQVTTGYSIRMTPRVNNDGTILLEYALDLSELNGSNNGFDNYTTGGQTVQLPNINSRNTVNQATIPAGSTLVLSGLERTRVNSTRTGTGAPDNFLFGGSRIAEVSRELVVVAITPDIIDLGYGRASR